MYSCSLKHHCIVLDFHAYHKKICFFLIFGVFFDKELYDSVTRNYVWTNTGISQNIGAKEVLR